MSKAKNKTKTDIKYGDYTIQRMINSIMWDGNKTMAERIVYTAIELLMQDEAVPKDMMVNEVIRTIMTKTKPSTEVVSRRVRGASYAVPMETKSRRAEMLAIRALRTSARARGRGMAKALARELLEAFQGTGSAVKQKQNTESMAKANRAFAHLGAR